MLGNPESFSAYRSELAGLHGGLSLLYAITETHEIRKGRIVIACDNNGVIPKITTGNVRPQDKHFDYLSGIQTIIKLLKIKVQFTHVEGHKDQVTSLDKLTVLEEMNVQADIHAKIKASIPPPLTLQTQAEVFKGWKTLRIRKSNDHITRLHSTLDTSLYDLLTVDSSQKYWLRKMKIPLPIRSQVNWQSLGSAFTALTPTKRKEVLKWNSGFCGTNAALLRRKQARTGECPGCNFPLEDTTHILTCKAPGATHQWNESITTLKTWLIQHDAAPELANAIIEGLTSWRNNHPMPRRSYTIPFLAEAVKMQSTMGWTGFLHGFLAIEWEHTQNNYLRFLNRRTTGRRWVAALIRKLWETIWAIWRYRNSLVHEQSNQPLHKVTALLNKFNTDSTGYLRTIHIYSKRK